MTLEQAVQMALERDAGIAAAQEAVRATQATVEASTQLENPVLRMRNVEVDELLKGESEFGMELRASPPRPGELDAREDRSLARVRRAEARLDEARWAMEGEVRTLFTSIRYLLAEESVADELVAARRARLEAYRARAAEGLATAVDVASAEVALQEAVHEISLLAGTRGELEEKLRSRLGLSSNEMEWKGPLVDPQNLVVLASRKELVETSLGRRSELEEAASRIDAAHADIYLEKLESYPWFSFVELGYRFGVEEIDPRDWTFRVALTVPIFSWNLGGIRAAEANRDWMERRFDAEIESATRDLEECYAAVERTAAAVQALQGDAATVVQEAYQKNLEAMEEGGVDAVSVALARERWAQLRRQQVRALHQYALALQNLFVATRGASENPR